MEHQNDLPPAPIEPEGAQDKLASVESSSIEKLSGGRGKKYIRFVIAAAASFSAERDQEKINELQRLWLREHQEKVKELGT